MASLAIVSFVEHGMCFVVSNGVFYNFVLLACLLNLLAMGTDHYIAVTNPLHCHEIMSNFRTNVIILLIWVVSVAFGFTEVIAALFFENTFIPYSDICMNAFMDDFDFTLVIYFYVLAELLVLIFLYLRVYLEFRKFVLRNRLTTKTAYTIQRLFLQLSS